MSREIPSIQLITHTSEANRVLGNGGVFADRLIFCIFLQVIRVHANEVDELGGGIDLSLDDSLRLTKHRGSVQLLAVFSGHQVGGLHPNVHALLQSRSVPLHLGSDRVLDGLLHELCVSIIELGDFMLVVIW